MRQYIDATVACCPCQVREYIDDTEDYVNVRLDHHRNQLFQFQITLSASALAIAVAISVVGCFSMNIPVFPYFRTDWFVPTVVASVFSLLWVFLGVVGYARYMGLFER